MKTYIRSLVVLVFFFVLSGCEKMNDAVVKLTLKNDTQEEINLYVLSAEEFGPSNLLGPGKTRTLNISLEDLPFASTISSKYRFSLNFMVIKNGQFEYYGPYVFDAPSNAEVTYKKGSTLRVYPVVWF